MSRTTIDFGIDLGTTNSTIAVIDGTDAKVVPNKAGSGITPSAVWIDRRGALHVGAESRERALVDDGENGVLEFKLKMGMGAEGRKIFARSGRELLPEELSAEVLKSLKMDVQSSMGEQVRAAVITVPAAFELPQTNATQKAAQLAGFARSALLLEPVAASLAYGFQTGSENVYWLVYDFGGGTFDAAVMRVRDGLIQVVNHAGDNHLGGKDLDWEIVTRKLIPALTARHPLPGFQRGATDPRWQVPLGRLKYWAEQAKIEVCRTRAPHEFWIDGLCQDAAGKAVDFSYTLTPQDIEEVGRPFIQRSLGLCRRTLQEKGLTAASLERVLMVGGTTLNPWLREAVAAELGDKLEFGIDPVTVVARGAAIFASTQRAPAEEDEAVSARGAWRIQIEHESVGDGPTPDIGGKVVAPDGRSLEGFTVELVDLRTGWRSGRITLGKEGVFLTQLFAEEKRRCEFSLELCDPTGTRIPTSPERVTYTIGVVPDRPPVANSFGVGLADESMALFIAKGTRLPAREVQVRHGTVPLRAGHAEDTLRIPVLEGEHARATRCHGIGTLVIRGTDIHRDLPLGSEIEITLTMDESQNLQVSAYVPVLDEDFHVRLDLQSVHGSLEELRAEAGRERERLAKAREKARKAQLPAADAAFVRIDTEQLDIHIQTLVVAAGTDIEARAQLDRRLRDLAAALDRAEDALEWPELVEQADVARRDAEKLVADFGQDGEKAQLRALVSSLQRALAAKDPDSVRQCSQDLDGLWFRIADRLLGYHIGRFNRLVERQASMTDAARAEQLVAQGRRAISSEDVDGLRAANRQLQSLLPKGQEMQEDHRIGQVI
jgi:molecular chaperone DnaK